MTELTRDDLWSLEQYAENRDGFRARVLAHKKNRKLVLAENIQLIFEDRLTIQYQIQEMLRIEKVFEAAGIVEELEAYNPLIPNGDNWKCTMLIQYQDVEERKKQLAALLGIEDKVWIKTGDETPVFAIADEDMDRANEQKTSAVHFLRFQLDYKQLESVRRGDALVVGINHASYPFESMLMPEEVRLSLQADIV